MPEWYFLPFYAILRAITFNIGPINSKLGGVLAMFGAIVVLFFVPWLDTSKVRSAVYRPWYKLFFWLFVANAILLGWLGSRPAEGAYVVDGADGDAATTSRFFLVIMPVLGLIETPRRLPNSITEAVLEKNKGGSGASGRRHGRAGDQRLSGENLKGISHEQDSHVAGGCSASWLAGTAGAVAAEEAHNAAAPTHFPIKKPKEMSWTLRRSVRHLRQGPAAARPEGLQGSLLGLPLDEPGGVPHARRTSAIRKRRSRRSRPNTTVQDGPNDDGEMFDRARRCRPTTSRRRSRTTQAAAAANGGAAPPDMSLLAKARGVERGFPQFVFDIFTQYAEGGPDYIHSLLTGYDETPPAGMEIPEGTHYNPYFMPALSLAMAKPLSDGQVTYDDGAPQTVDQYSRTSRPS